ncbi:dihydrofolate reductase family protein, partial [Streptomyces sp. 150FB]|uniref:dihydrofolate reductase family protein n=1 Tax=Streptomyces sp. 150FB TaxID=1576605 RepID=UPI000588F7D9
MRRLFPVTERTASAADRDRADDHGSGGDHGSGPGDHGGGRDREWSLDELAGAYAYPATGERPWLRANMVSSLDGAAQHDGRSQPLSSTADMRVFGLLRGIADAVVVGAETVRQEGYRPARAREALAERRAAAGQGP